MQNDVIVFTPLFEPLTDVTRGRLRNVVRREIARGHVQHVVDLSQLPQLDTKTLSELIRVRRWLREVGGFLHLVVRRPDLLKLLTITGLDRIFAVYATERDARAAIAGLTPLPV